MKPDTYTTSNTNIAWEAYKHHDCSRIQCKQADSGDGRILLRPQVIHFDALLFSRLVRTPYGRVIINSSLVLIRFSLIAYSACLFLFPMADSTSTVPTTTTCPFFARMDAILCSDGLFLRPGIESKYDTTCPLVIAPRLQSNSTTIRRMRLFLTATLFSGRVSISIVTHVSPHTHSKHSLLGNTRPILLMTYHTLNSIPMTAPEIIEES